MRTTEVANSTRAPAGAEADAAAGAGRRSGRSRSREGFDRLLDLLRAPARGAESAKAAPRPAAENRGETAAAEPEAREAPSDSKPQAPDTDGVDETETKPNAETGAALASDIEAGPRHEDAAFEDPEPAAVALESGAILAATPGAQAAAALGPGDSGGEPASLEDPRDPLRSNAAADCTGVDAELAARFGRSGAEARFAGEGEAQGRALGAEAQGFAARAAAGPGPPQQEPQATTSDREPPASSAGRGPRSLLEALIAAQDLDSGAPARESAALAAHAGGEAAGFERATSPAARSLEGLEVGLGSVAARRAEPGMESSSPPPAPSAGGAETLRITEDREVFAERLGRIIYRRARESGEQHFRIQLQPPRLGQLEIRLEMQRGQLRLAFDVESKAVRHLLHSSAAELQQSLQRQGLAVETIRIEVADFALERRAAEQQGGASGGGADPSFADERRREPGGEAEPALAAVAADGGDAAEWSVLGGHGGWIDTRV